MKILGISAYYHDSAAALVSDGIITAAAQEERFTRIKHDPAFPANAIEYCLQTEGVMISDIDHIVFYDKPMLKFDRLLETYLSQAPKGFKSFCMAMPVWPHAASAYFASPFDEAAVLCMDGVGEWATTSVWYGKGADLKPLWQIDFPHSLGMLYSAFTYYTGFRVNSGEYKLMGLAPYGEPAYVDQIKSNLIDIKDDGTFRLDMDYFNYATGLTMTSARFHNLFGGPPREAESEITQREMDLARSVQVVTEEIVLKLGDTVHKETGCKNLCMAGGVALNCVANGKLTREGSFDNIWIQPAAGDAGGAVGAALAVWHQYLDNEKPVTANDTMRGSYLGPEYSQHEIVDSLEKLNAVYEVIDNDLLPSKVAAELQGGKITGWFQGRMEFGPRALGGRSIIGDPRNIEMQSVMNLKIKYRESFRPFAPSVLAEYVQEYFKIDCSSPYMLQVAEVLDQHRIEMTNEQKSLFGIDKLKVPRSTLPSITHVDYSARIQTVHKETNLHLTI